jgi:selenide, water dikinase
MQEIRLTQYSHGAGCGCKISPQILDKILKTDFEKTSFPNLLIGNDTKDDAAVMDLGNGEVIISTTDFFMPIVDDPYDFGRIASANAISDIYAMGGEPLMAIAILGWPIEKLAPEIAQKVLEGSRTICKLANIPLAGGHSIDCPEPVFGLAVTGRAKKTEIKANSTANEGDLLYLTKPLGVGILTTAEKKGILKDSDKNIASESMVQLNRLGSKLGKLNYVTALTDVTGFGLLGHLIEIAEGSQLSAEINFSEIPVIPQALEYIPLKAIPGGTNRNIQSYGHKVTELNEEKKAILADPQTSGGLLIAVNPDHETEFKKFLVSEGFNLASFGRMVKKSERRIIVN